MNTVLQLLASLAILVFIHELGHFTMARLCGVRVERFYLFFHPWFSIFKYKSKRSGTVYGLGWLPLGGYCQMAGMVDESLDTETLKQEPKPDEFRSKSAGARMLIMAGGVIFNIILALLIYISVVAVWGEKYLDNSVPTWQFTQVAKEIGFRDGDKILSIDGETNQNVLSSQFINKLIASKSVVVQHQGESQPTTITMPADLMQRILRAETGFVSMQLPFVVGEVAPDRPAQGKLLVGDQVVGVNGQSLSSESLVREALSKHKGDSIELSVLRKGEVQNIPILLDSTGMLGVSLRTPLEIFPIEEVHYNFISAIPVGINRAWTTITNYVGSLKYIFTKEGAKQMGGLGTMTKLFPKTFDWEMFWSMSAFLSIILAVMNILPIPALDGGHILLLLLEVITGQKLSEKWQVRIQMAGLIFLVLLMLYANGNDVYRYLIK